MNLFLILVAAYFLAHPQAKSAGNNAVPASSADLLSGELPIETFTAAGAGTQVDPASPQYAVVADNNVSILFPVLHPIAPVIRPTGYRNTEL